MNHTSAKKATFVIWLLYDSIADLKDVTETILPGTVFKNETHGWIIHKKLYSENWFLFHEVFKVCVCVRICGCKRVCALMEVRNLAEGNL